MAQLILIKIQNKSAELLRDVDILNAKFNQKINYTLLMPGYNYAQLYKFFDERDGKRCEKICLCCDGTPENVMTGVILKPVGKPAYPPFPAYIDPYQTRQGYSELMVGAHISKYDSLKIDALYAHAKLLIALIFE